VQLWVKGKGRVIPVLFLTEHQGRSLYLKRQANDMENQKKNIFVLLMKSNYVIFLQNNLTSQCPFPLVLSA
jgi:predicted RNA-binding protein YlxR (DUF448 family)